MKFTLDEPPFAGRTGRGVTVAVLDSGVHGTHPHVGRMLVGRSFASSAPESEIVDRIGHGTAVAAAILEKAPGVELRIARIFDRHLATNIDVLADALVWSADAGAQLINLSLGTSNSGNIDRLTRAIAHVSSRGSIIISARESNDVTWYPGALPGVIGVVASAELARHELDVRRGETELPLLAASPFPRPIEGVPPERNVHGVSFAVANACGFLARAAESARGDLVAAIKEL